MTDVAAHTAAQHHAYLMHYPAHPARKSDPHYRDFDAYHKKWRPFARCHIGQRIGYQSCADAQGNPCPAPPSGEQPGLELHHTHIEFALQNGVDLAALETDYPGVSNPDEIGAWVESGANFTWYCAYHHRSTAAGVHSVAHADFEASQYVPGLTSPA